MSRIAPDWRAHLSVQLDYPVHEGEVVALHRSGLELPNQLGVRSQSLGHHEKSARVLVEPVYDAGSRNRRKLRRALQERIEQRPFQVALPGLTTQAPGLFVHRNSVAL